MAKLATTATGSTFAIVAEAANRLLKKSRW
jgi:hypothetical protein